MGGWSLGYWLCDLMALSLSFLICAVEGLGLADFFEVPFISLLLSLMGQTNSDDTISNEGTSTLCVRYDYVLRSHDHRSASCFPVGVLGARGAIILLLPPCLDSVMHEATAFT